jgi:hypothetical protein
MQYRNNIELSPHEKIRCQFSGSKTVIKLGIDVRQDFVVVAVHQESSDESCSIKCFFISLRSREHFPFIRQLFIRSHNETLSLAAMWA